MKSMTLTLVVVALLALFGSSQSAIANEGQVTLEQAIDSLDRAILESSDDDGMQLIQESAGELAFAMEREGFESSAGELALGNAYFIGQDLGRSILHYRRGLLIDPSDETLRQNLLHARSFVEPTVPENESNGWSWEAALVSWRGVVSRWALWYSSIAFLAIGSLALSVSVLKVSSLKLGRVAVFGFALGAVGLGLLGYEYSIGHAQTGVVVVMPGTGLYSGPGSGVYSAVYDGTLGVGTEGVVRESRGDWVRIELQNSQGGWVASDSVLYINSPDV
jgi:hypothetical protein